MGLKRENGWSLGGVYLQGLAMGAADVVPGVSGGTIALLFAIYARLVNAIRSASSRSSLRLLRQRGGIAEFWKAIDGSFLVALVLGILTSILLFARVITYSIEYYPVLLWSFFFGLILASIYLVGLRIKRWGLGTMLALLIGTALGCLVALASSTSMPSSFLGYFFSAAIAICAMILPGISGSFILVLLGKYHEVLAALNAWDWSVIIPFAMGAVVGLLSFSHLLAFLLHRFENLTLSLLTGFMAGAIVKVWPWRLPRPGMPDLDMAVWPTAYAEQGFAPHVAAAILLALFGGGVVLALGHLVKKKGE